MDEPEKRKRDDLLRAVFSLRAKVRGKTQAYGCFLDDPPFESAPESSRCPMTVLDDDVELLVNTSLRYQSAGEVPREVRHCAAPLEGFMRGHSIAWVEETGSGMWTPFWLRGEWPDVINSLQPGAPAPSGLSAAMRRVLVDANILVARDHEKSRSGEWGGAVRSAQTSYRANGYAVIRGLIHPLQLGAMRRYYRALVAHGGLPLGDSQVSGRYRLHSELIASFLHPQLAKIVGQIAREQVKPSYAYFASYQAGADLPRHVDRDQCEFSISLLVDYMPDPNGPCGWPLFLENPAITAKAHAADLGVGDGVFYRGRELIHFRHPLPQGHQSTSIF
ncbi:MAG: hypothetical protein ABI547_09480, partial [Betaproteobacteria bacterium]